MKYKRRSLKDIHIYKNEEFSYDGFQVVRGEFFSHINEPSITFNKNKIMLNTICIKKLPDVEYVQILVNPDEKKLAVRPCREDEKDSFKWRTNANPPKPKQVTCTMFFAKVMSLMNWNPANRYKLLGKLIESGGELLFTFDLNSPEVYQRVEKEDGSTKASRTPMYPSEWKNQFGIPVEEHKGTLQVNIFDGFAVFGMSENKGEERKAEENE